MWIFIPFLLFSLWLDDSLTFASGLSIILFGIIAFNVKSLNKYHALGKAHTTVSERRAILDHHTVEGQNSRLNDADTSTTSAMRSDKGPKTLYETKVFVYHIIYITIFSLFVFLIAPIYTFITDDVDVRWLIYPVVIGIIVIVTMIYPFQLLSWKRFVLTETSIRIGYKKFGVAEIKEVLPLDKKNIIYIYVTYTDNPFKLGVHREYYGEFEETLEMFCDKHNIPFKKK